jgi:hypothetical protein
VYEADIQKAIDRQLEIERKAAAWDRLRSLDSKWRAVNDGAVADLDGVLAAVHPAQTLSKR